MSSAKIPYSNICVLIKQFISQLSAISLPEVNLALFYKKAHNLCHNHVVKRDSFKQSV